MRSRSSNSLAGAPPRAFWRLRARSSAALIKRAGGPARSERKRPRGRNSSSHCGRQAAETFSSSSNALPRNSREDIRKQASCCYGATTHSPWRGERERTGLPLTTRAQRRRSTLKKLLASTALVWWRSHTCFRRGVRNVHRHRERTLSDDQLRQDNHRDRPDQHCGHGRRRYCPGRHDHSRDRPQFDGCDSE